MKTKKQKSNPILILIFFTITATASILWYFSQPQDKVLAGNTSNTTLINQTEEASQSDTTSEFPLSTTVNETTVEVEFAKATKEVFEVGICYPIPDNGDWYPTPGSLTFETYEIMPDEFEFTREIKVNELTEGKRCGTIRYRLDEVKSLTSPIKFTFLGFWAVPRETSACNNFEQRLESNVNAKAIELTAKCSEDNSGNFSATITGYNKAVTENDAQAVLDEIVRGETLGPWEFDITSFE